MQHRWDLRDLVDNRGQLLFSHDRIHVKERIQRSHLGL